MLRYRSDVRTLAFIALYFIGQGVAWFFVPWSPGWVAAAVGVLAWVSWINAVITHNVVHVPMWRSRALNRVTRVVLSLTYGFPVSEYVPGHNLSHHRYVQSRRDVMRTSKVRFRWNLLNLLAFFPVVAGDVMKANARYVTTCRKSRPRWYADRQTEVLVTWGVKALLLLIDWKRALLFVGLPHVGAVWGVTTVNFLWHDGCDPEHRYNHSRNFVGRFFNWFHFNNGFHGMHHLQPSCHWSLLPARHAELIRPHLHPALEQGSLLLYALRTFVLTAGRYTYEGKPAVSPAEGPDMDWIGTPDISGAPAEPHGAHT